VESRGSLKDREIKESLFWEIEWGRGKEKRFKMMDFTGGGGKKDSIGGEGGEL